MWSTQMQHTACGGNWENQHSQYKNKANLRDLIDATSFVILLILDSNHQFLGDNDLQI